MGSRTALKLICVFGVSMIGVFLFTYDPSKSAQYLRREEPEVHVFDLEHKLESPTWLGTRLRTTSDLPFVHPTAFHRNPRELIILFYSKFYIKPRWPVKMGSMDCGEYQCTLTSDRGLYDKSSAVVFHHRSPKWVNDVPRLRKRDRNMSGKLFVVYNRESNLWEPNGKDQLDVINGMINWTIGLRRDNDIYIPTTVVTRGRHLDGFDPNKNYLEDKKGFTAALLTSNCFAGDSFKLYHGRRDFIRALQNAGLNLDVYGACGKRCGSYANCASYLKNYKFVLTFENSLCWDYITEKPFIGGLNLGSVPVIATWANISDPYVLPPGSFINALNFSTPSELVRYMEKVGEDPKLYNRFFMWRANWTYTFVSQFEGQMPFSDDYFCPLCHRLHELKKHPWMKTISNYTEWYEQVKCRKFPTY